ncbi:segregation and condensation protein A [Streptomyces calvus]|uniref:segregation and condensation protein A n=1 Tax=Streptomyces calvus TaxID=67282 RepID=UPI003719D344
MTSHDAPAPTPGARPNRRRALGRGPGAPTPLPTGPPAPDAAPPAAAPAPDAPAADALAADAPASEPAAGPAPSPAPEAPAETPEGAVGPGSAEAPENHDEASYEAPVAPAVPEAPAASAAPVDGRAEASEAPEDDRAASRDAEAGDPAPASTPAPAPVSAAGGGGSVPVAAGAEAEDDGRFTVRLSNFEGPFDLLLQLIAKHKLDVTEVALSKVTDEFMAHIRAMGPDWDLDETTEFLVVAATLLDLKAARLLPAAEVEDEADLALLEARDLLFARLLQYRAYKQIAEIFSRRLDAEARRYPRTVGLEPQHAELLPEVVISIGAEGFAKLAVKAMQPRPRPQVYVDHIHAPLVSVQEQAAVVVARLRELGEASFRTLVADTDDTLTVVARFLALLELYREKAVALDQEAALGELTVRWTGGDGDAAHAVTDEFDRPPEQPEQPEEEKREKREKRT